VALRDTDADWRTLGETQPYWAVLSHPDYRTESLTPARIEAFYQSGRDYIGQVLDWLEDATGSRPAGPALDFGCGVGRLTEAMAEHVSSVTGVDVSPGMLELARGRGGRAVYIEALPEGRFDWINSFIVFQHIPPARGLELIDVLLARLAPGGFVSLQVTTWFEDRHQPPESAPRRDLFGRRKPAPDWRLAHETGSIFMYTYDLSEVVRRLNLAGLDELKLVHTDHDGHHGVIILGRQATQPRHA
jgi:SAM-dependent methyltransferase